MSKKLDPKERQLRDEMSFKGLLWCKDCNQFKPKEEFDRKSVRGNYGHSFFCKDCRKIRDKIRNHTGISKQSQRNKKFKLLQLAGGKCCRCGYDEFSAGLDFHHIDPAKKEHGQFIQNQGYEKALVEVKKCAILCRNCHSTYHAGEWTAIFIKRDGVGWTIKQPKLS